MKLMRTYFIKIRSLIAFGVALLALAFIWLGLSDLNLYQEASQRIDGVNQTTVSDSHLEDMASDIQPTVTFEPQNIEQKQDNFFIEYKIERDRTRSEQIEILREIVNNQNSSAQMRQEAQKKLIIIAEALEKESKVENALLAKGYGEAVAVMQESSVMVIISAESLRQDEVAQVSDIVTKMTGCRLEDVVIVPKAT